jgi:hypothetical protein
MLLGHSHSPDYDTFAEYEGRLRSSPIGECIIKTLGRNSLYVIDEEATRPPGFRLK